MQNAIYAWSTYDVAEQHEINRRTMVKLHLGYLRIARKCVSANACKSIGVNNENEFYCDLLFVCIKHTPTEEWPLEKIHARQRYLVLGPVFSHKNHIQFFVYRKNRGFFCFVISVPLQARVVKKKAGVKCKMGNGACAHTKWTTESLSAGSTVVLCVCMNAGIVNVITRLMNRP